jgi:hypothetical protein
MRRQFTLEFRVVEYSRSEQRFKPLSPTIRDESLRIIRYEDFAPGSGMRLQDECISQLVAFPFRQLAPVRRKASVRDDGENVFKALTTWLTREPGFAKLTLIEYSKFGEQLMGSYLNHEIWSTTRLFQRNAGKCNVQASIHCLHHNWIVGPCR